MTRRRSKTPKWLAAARAAGSDRPVSGADFLGRALPRAGVLNPVELEAALAASRVRIDSRVVMDPLAPLPPDAKVFVDDVEVSLDTATLALAFNKPDGVVTARVDPEGQGTVFASLAAVLRPEHAHFGWHAVGRLDRHTTGLLLFTNDERLVAHVTRPATQLSKRYLAHVNGGATDEKLEPLRHGITLTDGPTRPARALIRGPGMVELTLTEGRHHQVKRMLSFVELPVTTLHREAVGGVECDLPPGQYRTLSAEELRDGLRFDAVRH